MFNTIRERLTMAPVLCMPDPVVQFIAVVDASDIGIGIGSGVVMRKYDRDRDKELALQEWRYWLEGGKHSVLMDGP